ncbi:protein deacetylase sirtuin-2 [Seminavis robusta]|uniref:Protein deacetylase sirtuin-2 n=1 Tax=Seminavis robusta TaxID=568900 RepID=A0A9N8HC30_9STRA|nr:protein deacetylase sirtuin-2 [Seminavis robusta]|eukprot:Sro390_g132750.1 protein deacetylase sirtuin-2 (378) ;mRNA; f:9296-10506
MGIQRIQLFNKVYYFSAPARCSRQVRSIGTPGGGCCSYHTVPVVSKLLTPWIRSGIQLQRCNLSSHSKSASSGKQNDGIHSETVRTVAKWIQDLEKQGLPKIIVLCGAGVSVAAGIPDFRSPGTGLYDNLQKYNLPYPEAVFDLDYYRQRPQAFLSLAKEIWPGVQEQHSPTLTHSFLALLEQNNLLLRCYTQNIDGLEFLGGMSSDKIMECHGHFRSASCIRCGSPADIEKVKESILQQQGTPMCEQCHIGHVKPDIVFFGEALPPRLNLLIQNDLPRASLMLILGTSLQVVPVSLIPDWVPSSCRRVLLNRELVGNLAIGTGSHPNEKSRDLFQAGDCDDSILAICRALGWEDLLRKQNEATRIRATATTTMDAK